MQVTRASWDTEELHDEAWQEATRLRPLSGGMLEPTQYAPAGSATPKASGMLRRVLAVLALHILLPIVWPL